MRPRAIPSSRIPRARPDVRRPRTDLIALLLVGQTEKMYCQSSILHPAGEGPGFAHLVGRGELEERYRRAPSSSRGISTRLRAASPENFINGILNLLHQRWRPRPPGPSSPPPPSPLPPP